MIRRRRAEIHETKTGHERWLVSYADFITLLFAFFVVMYSVSQVSENKYRALSDTLAQVFEGQVPNEAQVKELLEQYPLDESGSISGISPEVNLVDADVLLKELEDVFVQLVESHDVTLSATEAWVEINVNANMLFASGSAAPSRDAQLIFAEVARVLAPYDNEVEVAGHTDSIPIASSNYASNWDLSSARAVSVVKLLASDNISAWRLSAVGYGEFRPVADNNTPEGRAQNRRVVLRVARHQPDGPRPTPLKPRDSAVPTEISVPDSAPESAKSDGRSNSVTPIRLDSGGLLFTSDPRRQRDAQ